MPADAVSGDVTLPEGPSDLVETFLDHVEHGRPEEATDLALSSVHRGGSVTEVVQGLLAPTQQLVGQRWQSGRYTVAQEHVTSAVVDDVLGLLTAHTARPTGTQALVLVCAEGEWHTTPARMTALCLRDAGWRVHFLGGSMPAEHLALSLPQLAPDAVAISCTQPLALGGVPPLIEASVRNALPVLTGGFGFGPDDRRSRHLGAHGHATGVTDAVDLLTTWLDQPPDTPAPVHDADADRERAEITARRDELVEATHARLRTAIPAVARYDDRQRHHVDQDLHYVLKAVDIALLVDDPRILTDLTRWLGTLLETRGVPAGSLDLALVELQDLLPDDMVRSRDLLEQGRHVGRA